MDDPEHVSRFVDGLGRDGSLLAGPVEEWRRWWQARARELGDAHPARNQGFVLRTSQLHEVGVGRYAARRNVRLGVWSTTQPKSLAVVDPGEESDRFAVERRRHALACAAAAVLNPGFAVSGTSAAILHGLPTLTVPGRPQLTAPVRLNAHRRGKATIRADEVTQWYGIPVLCPARTVVDAARHERRNGLVIADAALREELVGPDDLATLLGRARGWCGVRSARAIVRFADGRAESPLESLTRLALADSGFPPPELQTPIAVAGRRRPYLVDLCWPDRRLILECDGRVKYERATPWQEKRREVAIERAGFRVLRLLWSDVAHDWARTAQWLWTFFH